MAAQMPPVIRKFNPGAFQPDEEVIKQFVVRHREFNILMGVLRNNAGASPCQHMLVVAPRGRGKTMMLARIAAELRTSTTLQRDFLPVRFMEESYEVFDLGDFWLEALFHLAPEAARHDAEIADELREAHAEFARRWRGRDLEERARAIVLETVERLGKKLVLMVENCQSLFDDADKRFGWGLRKTLQTENNVIFLGTATTRIAALDDVQAPFYEFFRPLLLEPLPLDECKALWEAASGDVRSEREIRPLQILTGGDPRLLVIIAGFARHRSLKELLQELVSLIDDHTEYFRSHLEGLGKTERRVYLALIDLWQPSTTAEIAARAMQDIRVVSSLLGRLVKRGAVTYEGSGRKRLYAATQRLYGIYYKLRRQRDEALAVRSLIQWMLVCFPSDELSITADTLAEAAIQSMAVRDAFPKLAGGVNPLLDATELQWAEWTRARALLGKQERTLALEVLRAAYDNLIIDEETPRRLLYQVPELIGCGLAESDLMEILTSDRRKHTQLSPLVVALGLRIGQQVRAPVEVLEAAQDLAKHLDEAIAKVKAR